MLDQNGLVFKHTEVQLHMHAQLSVYVPLVFTIVANNGIMVIPSLPHGSTKTILMRNYQSKNWGLMMVKKSDEVDEKLSIKELGPKELLPCFECPTAGHVVSASSLFTSRQSLTVMIPGYKLNYTCRKGIAASFSFPSPFPETLQL